jgi:hypothetical protein
MNRIVIFLALLAVAVTACGISPQLTEESVVYVDAWVKRNNPAVFVQPQNAPKRPFKAVILPFKMQQDINNGREIAKQLTEVFWQTWTKENVFPSAFYEPTMEGASNEQAILIGRDRGADCVVTGRIVYLLAGGTRSDSAISISFEIFDVNTGQRIWSMGHTGRMETSLTGDYVIFRRETRMPMDPLWAIMTAIAADTGGPIKKWNNGQQYQQPGATSAPVSAPKDYAPAPAPKAPLKSSNLEQ